MGKSRRNRARPRKDPIAKAGKPPSDPELAALREKSVLPVIKDLQSSDPKARTSAASAISNLVSDKKCRKLFLREQIVHIVLTQTLTDASLDSRAAGWDILRVLAEEEEPDFCVHLFRQDVLSAVDFASKTLLEALGSDAKLGNAESKVVWSMASSLVALVTALSEAQDEILEAIVGLESTVNLLALIIAGPGSPSGVRLDALSCLLTLVEDNQQLAEFFVADEEPKPFSALLNFQAGQGAARVLACGILHNIYSVLKWFEGSPGNKDLSDASLVRTLSLALEDTKIEDDVPASSQWSKVTEVTQLALEILASIGTSLQESMTTSHPKVEGEWGGIDDNENDVKDDAMEDDADQVENEDEGMDDSKAGEDEDMDEDDIEDIQADMDMVTGVNDDNAQGGGPTDELPTLRELVNTALPPIIRLANPETRNEDSAQMQSTALSTLNNVAWSVSCFDISKDENESIFKVWLPAGKSVWKGVVGPVLAANTADVELASQITSLAWAVSRTLPAGQMPLQGDEHKKFMSLYQAAKKLDRKAQGGANGGQEEAQDQDEDPFQGLGVKCIGVLGQLALGAAPVHLNREIGVFLITVLSSLSESPAADVVEALNRLFDIYGDEDRACDKEVFWNDNFLGHLQEVQPKVKALVKRIDKRSHQELRSRADEASLNLGRFIEYKKKNRP